jgi:hypothetical protein
MTPEQMIGLAARLLALAADMDGSTGPYEPEVRAAADLIRQMAEPPTETGPWEVKVWPDKRVVVDSDDFTHDVSLIVCGDFESDEQRMQYARMICERLNTAPQPDDTAIQPDWNQLEAAQESLREHMQMIHDDTALLRQALTLLIRYRNGTPIGHQPHMTAHEADDAIAALRARLDGAPQPDDTTLLRQARLPEGEKK